MRCLARDKDLKFNEADVHGQDQPGVKVGIARCDEHKTGVAGSENQRKDHIFNEPDIAGGNDCKHHVVRKTLLNMKEFDRKPQWKW